ncbi:MAG: hypothetical protein ACOX1I_01595 [Dethiobacteria bacterium]|jgi:hypothetical protein
MLKYENIARRRQELLQYTEKLNSDTKDVNGGCFMNNKNILVTTGDLKEEYEIIGPVYFQVSNKGLISSQLSK